MRCKRFPLSQFRSLGRFLIAASCLCLGLILNGTSAQASTVADISSHYQIEIWTSQDDLSNRTINAISQDGRGYLWLATRGGLIRFDGRDFKERELPDRFRPRGNNIRSIARTIDGQVVIQPTSAQIVSVTEKGFAIHPASESVSHLVPHRLQGASDGSLWISIRSGNVFRWQAKQGLWLEGLSSEAVAKTQSSFVENAKGDLWISTPSLSGIYRDKHLTPLPKGIGTPHLLAKGFNESLLVFEKDRLLQYRNGTLDTLATDVPWSNAPEQLSSASVDSYGTLWIAAGRFGLLHWNDGKFHPAPKVFPVVNDVFKDREGTIWVASEGNGLGRIHRKAMRLLNSETGLAEDVSVSLQLDPQNNIWIANANGGLYRMVDGEPQRVALSYQDLPLAVNVLSFDLDNTLWIGNTSGLYRSEPPYATVEKLPEIEGEVHLLFTASNGDLWCGTTFGKFGGSQNPATFGYYRDGTAHLLTSENGYNGHSIMSIEEGEKGEIWAGTYDGELLRYHEGEVNTEYSGSSIPDLHFDSQGNLWIATLKGLLLRTENAYLNVNRTLGYSISYASSIQEDSNGNLWYGLYKFPKDKLLAAIASTGPSVSPKFAGGPSRHLDLSFLVNWYPTSLADPDGNLWFATSRGVLIFDPSTVPPNTVEPRLYLDSVMINGKEVDSESDIAVPPGQHRFEASFSVPFFDDSRNIKVRYRLLGAGEDWLDARDTRTLSYSALSPGNYELQLQSSTGEDWRRQPLAVAFRVLPHWWQTVWFIVFASLLTLVACALAVRKWSQRRLRERLLQLEKDQALERERTRIARDLHDDLGGGLSALQLLASRTAKNGNANTQSNLNRLAERARRLNADVHSIVWLFTPGDGTLRNLAELIQKYAREVLKGSGIDCTGSDPNLIPAADIPPDAQHNIFFAAKEALANLLKHSKATRATISFAFEGNTFTCKISDDGVGLSDTNSDFLDGNGLNNMKARLAEVGGTLHVESKPNHGTTIIARYPLPH
ncbi:two-component regulator propeller domain-containing protein [Pelagicoccus enzymogenes]|uniref:sensor histidine kinase n=1 Tax=Pelagicoccus enzymogenes TaxID=2773457 RepID=UPI00280EDEC0|nr:two-component regulator propeller domain-containing protein [Pelagicoccus enzymogenes]MDQ8199650.1 two-component regulator propeller domain-containing protein [Pelagicoccus enzymogenes]